MAHDRQRQVALAQTRQSMIRPGYIMSRTLRCDRAVQIDVFADQLGGYLGPCSDRRLARPWPIHAPEVGFIGEHDAQIATTPPGGPPGFPYSIRKTSFLKAFCAARSRLG
jgi:hypothetical protein